MFCIGLLLLKKVERGRGGDEALGARDLDLFFVGRLTKGHVLRENHQMPT
jgi:hypothetical protein